MKDSQGDTPESWAVDWENFKCAMILGKFNRIVFLNVKNFTLKSDGLFLVLQTLLDPNLFVLVKHTFFKCAEILKYKFEIKADLPEAPFYFFFLSLLNLLTWL